jgi:type VI secretion system protein ImpC
MDDSSNSKSLLRVRPPRVRITYDVETGGAAEKKELPFIAGILADLSGDPDEKIAKAALKDRKFLDIDRDSFNDVMKNIGPRVKLDTIRATSPILQELLTQEDDLVIGFSSMWDFDPMQIVSALPSLNALYQSRTQMQALLARIEMDNSFFNRLVALLAASDIGAAINVLVPSITLTNVQTAAIRASVLESSDHLLAAIETFVTHIDRQLSAAVSAILHADSFKQLEATWRGLQYLVQNTEPGVMLKLRVLDANKDELRIDMKRSVEFDQSALFKLVYEAEYGTYGGAPYSLLVGAYEITNEQDDIDFLGKISQVAASAHAPFIAAASCQLFDLPGFDKLDKPRVLSKIFEGMDLSAWHDFRNNEEARYVSLVLPRVLMRLPYGKPTKGN